MKAITVGSVVIPWHKEFSGRCGWPMPGGTLTLDASLAQAVAETINRISKPVPPLPDWLLEDIRNRGRNPV